MSEIGSPAKASTLLAKAVEYCRHAPKRLRAASLGNGSPGLCDTLVGVLSLGSPQ